MRGGAFGPSRNVKIVVPKMSSQMYDRWTERERRMLNVTLGAGERKRPTGFLPSADSSPDCDR